MKPLKLLAFSILLSIVCAPTSALAESHEPSPFELHLEYDLPVLAVTSLLSAMPTILGDELPPTCDPCDPSGVNALDRTVIGNDSDGAALASHVLMAAAPALALGFSGLHVPRHGWGSMLEDSVMIAESVTVALSLRFVVNMAVRRPRPYMYQEGLRPADRGSTDASMSFFSGHAATAFAAATSFATIYTVRRPHSRFRWLVWVLALAVATPVAVLRVEAGVHFWTDVIAGAVVGTASGVMVPLLHRRTPAETRHQQPHLTVAAGPGGLSLVGRF